MTQRTESPKSANKSLYIGVIIGIVLTLVTMILIPKKKSEVTPVTDPAPVTDSVAVKDAGKETVFVTNKVIGWNELFERPSNRSDNWIVNRTEKRDGPYTVRTTTYQDPSKPTKSVVVFMAGQSKYHETNGVARAFVEFFARNNIATIISTYSIDDKNKSDLMCDVEIKHLNGLYTDTIERSLAEGHYVDAGIMASGIEVRYLPSILERNKDIHIAHIYRGYMDFKKVMGFAMTGKYGDRDIDSQNGQRSVISYALHRYHDEEKIKEEGNEAGLAAARLSRRDFSQLDKDVEHLFGGDKELECNSVTFGERFKGHVIVVSDQFDSIFPYEEGEKLAQYLHARHVLTRSRVTDFSTAASLPLPDSEEAKGAMAEFIETVKMHSHPQ